MQSSDKPVFAFGSRLPRFQEKKSITPGPGEYDVNDCIGFEAWVKKQPSAGFLDHRERFIKECLGFADGELVPRCGDTLRRTLVCVCRIRRQDLGFSYVRRTKLTAT